MGYPLFLCDSLWDILMREAHLIVFSPLSDGMNAGTVFLLPTADPLSFNFFLSDFTIRARRKDH